MTAPFAEALAAEAGARGIELPAAEARALSTHCRLLLRWNRSVRLTAITDETAIRERHVLESLQALPLLPAGPGRLLDVGSGNGFPALPLLLLRPDLTGELLEPVVRKRAFLKEVIREIGIADRVTVSPDRIDVPRDLADRRPLHCVTARAVDMAAILAGAAAALDRRGRAILFIGRKDADAIRAAPPPGLRCRELHLLRGRDASFIAVLEPEQVESSP